MNINDVKNSIRANMKSCALHGKNIEFESKSNNHGKVLTTAVMELAGLSNIKIKRLKKGVSYKDFDVLFYSSSDAHTFYNKVQSLAKESQQPIGVRFSRGQTTAISHNENDTTGGKKWYEHIGSLGNWLGGIVGNVSGVISNKFDSEEAAAQAQAQAAQTAAQAQAQAAQAQAQAAQTAAQAAAEAEAQKSKTIMIAVGAGVLVLALVLILALRKK